VNNHNHALLALGAIGALAAASELAKRRRMGSQALSLEQILAAAEEAKRTAPSKRAARKPGLSVDQILAAAEKAKRAAPPKKRTTRPKGTSTRQSPTTPGLNLLGGGVISSKGQTIIRPFLVVEVSPQKYRAFYMSSGRNTPGMTPAGTWVNFGGIADHGTIAEDGKSAGRSFEGWFIKPRKKFGSKTAYALIGKKLAQEVGSTVPDAVKHLRKRFGRGFLSVDFDQMGAQGAGSKVNALLDRHGAIDPYAGSEDEERKRGLDHGWLKDNVKPAKIGAKTVYAAPRISWEKAKSSAQPAQTGSSLEGVTVVFTGFRDRELAAAVEEAGGYPSERYTKATGLVVAKDPTRQTGKVKKAHQAGIEVISIPQLRRRVRGQRPQRSSASTRDADEHRPAPAKPRANPIRGGVLLAKKWSGQDPTGMWASEKLDGIRAYWNGEGFYSRNGNRFEAPAWFTDLLPKDQELDGELYIGPGQLYDALSVVRSHTPGAGWAKVRYMVFDAPLVEGPFRTRMQTVRQVVNRACRKWRRPGACPIVEVQQVPIRSAAELDTFHKRVTAQGIEGTMLRDPDSRYERRRSGTLLKLKDFHDAEGEVIGYKAGANVKVGSYKVRDLENGAVFTVDARHAAAARRGQTLPVGTVITYRYQERTPSGKPRHPIMVAVRDYE
jgi:DNA ligase-1